VLLSVNYLVWHICYSSSGRSKHNKYFCNSEKNSDCSLNYSCGSENVGVKKQKRGQSGKRTAMEQGRGNRICQFGPDGENSRHP
jgi:hypothetical protein